MFLFRGQDYDKSFFQPGGVKSPIDHFLGLLKDPQTMASLDALVKESYKFIRLADDLHEIRSYLNDIRLCFIALTVSGYVGILLYALIMCLKRKKGRGGNGRDGDSGGRYRGSGSPSRQRSGSRFVENFDLEAGGGMILTGGQTSEWDETNNAGLGPPPPPNGTAIRTPDGYRYKPPNLVRRSSGGGGVSLGSGAHPYHQRTNTLDAVDVSKSSPPAIGDNYNFQTTGVMMSSASSGSPVQQQADSGFIEKVK